MPRVGSNHNAIVARPTLRFAAPSGVPGAPKVMLPVHWWTGVHTPGSEQKELYSWTSRPGTYDKRPDIKIWD